MNSRLGLIAILLLAFGLAAGDAFSAKPRCGDGKCSGGETVESCPADCSDEDVCGDGTCGPTETVESCPADCDIPPPGDCNNDGVCNAGEDCLSCGDCPGRTNGKPSNRYCCGADTCETSQCGADCGAPVPECGNGIVEYNEECDDGPSGSATCDIFCNSIAVTPAVPLNQFNIGDSIGEGEAANGTIGAANHQAVWSTGYDGGDVVNSLNERFEARDAAGYLENNSIRDSAINQAVSGAVMADFANQANAVVASMDSIEPGAADMVSILLGNNDVCADSLAAMTDPVLFEQQYRAGLDVLANSPIPESVNLLVSGVPAIYWLWDAKRTNLWCRVFAWPFVPCQNLLAGAADDCVSSASAQDPDVIYPGDGANCQRRKQFHALIRDVYNPMLSGVLAEYQGNGMLLNAEYVDIYDVRFESEHVNGGDCFHPSKAGHALMSGQQWCRSSWGEGDPACSP
jgi:lysophospholipase L1-like esterase